MQKRELFLRLIFWIGCWLCVFTNTLLAHDYWLESDKTQISVSENAAIRLMFGENFGTGAEKTLQPERTSAFRLYGQSRKFSDLLSQPTPTVITATKEGTILVTMKRSPAEISFGRAKFLDYASKEGNVIGDSDLPASQKRVGETYTRYLKTLVQVGGTIDKKALKTTGQDYEIVPLTHPFEKGLTELKIKVLFQHKPASGVKVTAVQRLGGKLTPLSEITNTKGQCILPITETGRWLIRSVKIVPDATEEGQPVSFHSYWASLTFGYE